MVYLAINGVGIKSYCYNGDTFINAGFNPIVGEVKGITLLTDGTVINCQNDSIWAYSHDGSNFNLIAKTVGGGNNLEYGGDGNLSIISGQNGTFYILTSLGKKP